MIVLERIVCYIAAAAFFYLTFRLVKRNRNTWLISASLILAFLSFLCSLSWFQGVFKTHIISVVYSTLETYGNKLDEFQKTTARMQVELTTQQTKINTHVKSSSAAVAVALGRAVVAELQPPDWEDFELDAAAGSSPLQPPAPQPVRAVMRPGRNDPCPCGSGKKFKKCCGAA